VQGAWCWKQFGKHGALHNPYAYGFFDHVEHRGSPREGHVTVGGLFYDADRFPARFHGKLITGDLLGHAVRWHDVTPLGSTVRTTLEGDLVVANDTWFATSDLTLGPDGAVYVADWSDRRTAHPDPDADWDRSNGRIYAVHAAGDTPPRPVDLAALNPDQLISTLSAPNAWHVRRARRLLAEQRDPAALAKLREIALKPDGTPRPVEAVWTLSAAGAIDDELATRLLEHPDEDVRYWTVRTLGDRPTKLGPRLVQLARTEPSATVRAQLASTAGRLEASDTFGIGRALLARDVDGDDPHTPLLLWWAVERPAAADPERALSVLGDKDLWNSRLNRREILGRLLRRFVAEGSERTDRAASQLLASAPTADDRRRLLDSLAAGLRERPAGAGDPSARLGPPIAALWGATPDDRTLIELAVRLGHGPARGKAVTIAADRKTPPATRASLIGLLAERPGPLPDGFFLTLATGDTPPAVQTAALDALAGERDPKVADALLAAYPSKPAPWRAKARSVLLGRKSGASKFLAAVTAKTVDAAEVPVDELRAVALHNDPTLDALVRKNWGAVTTGTPEEKLAEVRRLNNDLRAATGDAAKGKLVFQKHCATCHTLFGEGKNVGPELTHANRGDKDFLLVSLVDPSAVVRKEYQSSVVATKDGRVLTGIVDESDPNRVVVLAAGGEKTAVPSGEVESVQPSAVSLMPENLYRQLSPEELRDLFGYLGRSRP